MQYLLVRFLKRISKSKGYNGGLSLQAVIQQSCLCIWFP